MQDHVNIIQVLFADLLLFTLLVLDQKMTVSS
jgi:hypothetical protein